MSWRDELPRVIAENPPSPALQQHRQVRRALQRKIAKLEAAETKRRKRKARRDGQH